MVAYFVRRLVGGFIKWLLAAYVLFCFVVGPTLSGINRPVECFDCYSTQSTIYVRDAIITLYGLDKPWPESYFVWLLEPHGTLVQSYVLKAEVTMGGAHPERTVQVTRSGLLRGDFGVSLAVQRGTPTLDLYGINFPLFLTFMLDPLLTAMLLAVVQRRGRPNPYYRRTYERASRQFAAVRIVG